MNERCERRPRRRVDATFIHRAPSFVASDPQNSRSARLGPVVASSIILSPHPRRRHVPELVLVRERLPEARHEEHPGSVRRPAGDAREGGPVVGDLPYRSSLDGHHVHLLHAALLLDDERHFFTVRGDHRPSHRAGSVRQPRRSPASHDIIHGVQVILAHKHESSAVQRRPAVVPARVGIIGTVGIASLGVILDGCHVDGWMAARGTDTAPHPSSRGRPPEGGSGGRRAVVEGGKSGGGGGGDKCNSCAPSLGSQPTPDGCGHEASSARVDGRVAD